MGGRGSSFKRTGYTPPTMAPAGPSASPERTEPEDSRLDAVEPGGPYHYFYDKISGGWTYEGDGHHQISWFKANSNVDDVISATTSDDRAAMRDWASGHFMGGQQYRGWDALSMTDKEYTQRYDDMLDKSVINKGVSVVRRTTAEFFMGAGVTRASLSDLQALEGKDIVSKANLSTGAAAQGLTIGAHDKHHEIRIKIPAGSKGAGMWIGDSRINPGWKAQQREFMMNRDIVVKVGKTTYDSSRDVYVTEVTYTGRMPHDYGKSGRLKL